MGKILTKKDLRKYVKNNLKYANKKSLMDVLRNNNIKVKNSLNQTELIDLIIKNKLDMWDIYTHLEDKDLGLHPAELEKMLNINKTIRKKLEKFDLLKVAYTKSSRVYSRTIDTPYYSLFSLYNLTHEKLSDCISKNYRKPSEKAIEGYKKAQITKELSEEIKYLEKLKNQLEYGSLEFKALMRNKDKYVILDAESTGLSEDDEIIDISIIDLDGNVLFESLINTDVEITEGAWEVHRLSKKDLLAAPKFNDVKDQIKEILDNKIMLAYNSEFDKRLLIQSGYNYPIKDKCLMYMFGRYADSERWISLQNVMNMQGIKINQEHRAKSDCFCCLELIKSVINDKIINDIDEEIKFLKNSK